MKKNGERHQTGSILLLSILNAYIQEAVGEREGKSKDLKNGHKIDALKFEKTQQ